MQNIMDSEIGTIVREKKHPKRKYKLGEWVNDTSRILYDLVYLGMKSYINKLCADDYEIEKEN